MIFMIHYVFFDNVLISIKSYLSHNFQRKSASNKKRSTKCKVQNVKLFFKNIRRTYKW